MHVVFTAIPPVGTHRKLLKVSDVELLSEFVWEDGQRAVMSAGLTPPSITDTVMTTENVPSATDSPTPQVHLTSFTSEIHPRTDYQTSDQNICGDS